ncbi:MAG: ABC transporter ATP-binding protein [Actinomycetota bacterium]|nr:MAG: ABC transporter ATP-binding protein [Actinomycetota bacterium]
MNWGVESATVSFGSQIALDGVTLHAERGSVTVVIGGDGAGKSTCLRTLVGLIPLDSGTVNRPAKKEIGYVSATGGVYPDLTVDENLAFFGGSYGLKGSAFEKRHTDVLEMIGLRDFRERLAGQLSGGMQRKLAVGLALLHQPLLLVLDEPTTGLDPLSRAELWRVISHTAAQGAAVVISTTYVNEAQRASLVILLSGGRSIAEGSPSQIIAAVPGKVGMVKSVKQPPGLAWRWGGVWHIWEPSKDIPEKADPIEPDFDDAVIIAELAQEIGTAR